MTPTVTVKLLAQLTGKRARPQRVELEARGEPGEKDEHSFTRLKTAKVALASCLTKIMTIKVKQARYTDKMSPIRELCIEPEALSE